MGSFNAFVRTGPGAFAPGSPISLFEEKIPH